MKALSLLLFAFLPNAHADEVNGNLALQLSGGVRYCNQQKDSFGEATAYQLSNLKLSVQNDLLIVETKLNFLRCVSQGETTGWHKQDIFSPVRYSI